MASFTRSNAWNNGGTFDNQDLFWYAKGVGEMMARSLDDPNSWWFFAAIHGQRLAPGPFPSWGSLLAPPAVPTSPVPSSAVRQKYWDQCQHQSWYFAPWHRGYLIALEAQIREAVISLGGPSDWSLPYWNYFGPDGEDEMPPAFAEENLPDGSPNPLFVTARYGPLGNGDIFVPSTAVSSGCQTNNIYTGSNAVTPFPGFGGPDTGFSHGGGTSGNLEQDPHNLIHVIVGGRVPNTNTRGLMTTPAAAALDPIFYLHHCNIDRMWAAWNSAGNGNPTDANWLVGPAAVGEREFVMPMPNDQEWVYTPAEVNSLDLLDYAYDSLVISPPIAAPINEMMARAAGAGRDSLTEFGGEGDMDTGGELELVGTNEKSLQLKSSGARANVKLDSSMKDSVLASFSESAVPQLPDHAYLGIENVRGNDDSYILDVSVNQRNVGTISLFGLENASDKDGSHGGEGLNFVLDITNVLNDLFFGIGVGNGINMNELDVRIVPRDSVTGESEITIGRVSVYRQGQK